MLRIHQDAIHMVRYAADAAACVARYDADLARQLRRAASSVPLNIAEGSGVAGRNRLVRYSTALGSAREVRSCIDVALALGYLRSFPDDAADCLDKVTATLVRVSR